ncbi:MAG TPA: hypothetical protein VE991_11540 [Acidimicrobiales bacterium]|nr:hypothetical protein [Acidimicrobiales bacterium]
MGAGLTDGNRGLRSAAADAALGALRLKRRAARASALARLSMLAKAKGSSIDLDVAGDLEVGKDVRFWVEPGTRNVLRIGPGVQLLDRVLVHLKGGTVELGEGVQVRRDTVLNVSGRFVCEGHNIISYANLVHCAEEIVLEQYASTNEFVSIIDSTHHHDGERPFFYENMTSAPIRIGANAWICNKASVLMGVHVGANSVVASHSVVNKDVPEATVVGGVPARVVAERKVGEAARALADGQRRSGLRAIAP